MTLAPGTTVGRYQILEPLGQGGMATVYKAFQPSLQREVALKVLRPGYAQDKEFLERFEREAIAIAKLRHPHIVQVFDFETSEGQYVLAMEFLEGGTLKDRLTELASSGRGLDPQQAVRIVAEVAEALSYAHELGIVHRDIKPSNVMLTRRDWAVVTDFGIARILGATSHTQTGVGIGTPEYMAPEQGQGGAIDHRADIYSLGAMAYELLVGRVPYVADTPLAVVLAHMKDPLPLPSTMNPTIGKAVERVLLKALAKDREQRFSSATDFAQALKDALDADAMGGTVPTIVVRGAAVASKPATSRATAAVARSFTVGVPDLGRRGLLAAGAGVLVVAAVIGTVVVSGALGRPSVQLEPTAQPGAAATAQPTPALTQQVVATPAASPGPGASATTSPPKFAIPPKGQLVWQAKLDGTQSDLRNISNRPGPGTTDTSPGASELRTPAGMIEAAILRKGGGLGFGLASPSRRAYVFEADLSIVPGAQSGMNVNLRRNYFLRLDTGNEEIRLFCAGDGQQEDAIAPVLVADMQKGRSFTIAVVVEESRFTLYVDQRRVGLATVRCSTASPQIPGFGIEGQDGTGSIRFHGIRIYDLPPSLVTQSVPARGLLAYEARLDGSGVDLAGPQPAPNHDFKHVPGAIEIRYSPTASAYADLNFDPPRASYVLETALSFEPGTTIEFRVSLRGSGATRQEHMLRVSPRTRTVDLLWIDASGGPAGTKQEVLTSPVPIPELETGRVLWLAVVVDGPRMTVFLDQVQISQANDARVSGVSGSTPGLRTWAEGTGVIRVHAVRVYEMPKT